MVLHKLSLNTIKLNWYFSCTLHSSSYTKISAQRAQTEWNLQQKIRSFCAHVIGKLKLNGKRKKMQKSITG